MCLQNRRDTLKDVIFVIFVFALSLVFHFLLSPLYVDDAAIEFAYDAHLLAQKGELVIEDTGASGVGSLIAELRAEFGVIYLLFLSPFSLSYHFWGVSEFSTFLPVSVTLLTTISVIYLISCKLFGRQVGILAVFLWSVFPSQVFFASGYLLTMPGIFSNRAPCLQTKPRRRAGLP